MAAPVALPPHVLVADDVHDLAESLALLLSLSSPQAITTDICSNGAEAVALARSTLPALAILDLDMPVMGGIDAAWAIRAVSPDAPPPVLVAMTGNPEHFKNSRARDVFDHVFTKPVSVDTLLALLDPA